MSKKDETKLIDIDTARSIKKTNLYYFSIRIYTRINPSETNRTKNVTHCIDLDEVKPAAELSDEEDTDAVSLDDDVVDLCSLEATSLVVADADEASVSTLSEP